MYFFLPQYDNKIFKARHAGPHLPHDGLAGKPFVSVEAPNGWSSLVWSFLWQQSKKQGEKILTSGLDMSLSTSRSTARAPRHSTTDHSRRQIHKQISRNYLRDGCQKELITFSLSNGRSWPLMPEGLQSLPQVERWLSVLELLSFFFKKKKKKEI